MATKYRKFTGATGFFECLTCKEEFPARLADRARGWARYCSKSCKAVKQTQRQNSAWGSYREREQARDDSHGHPLCFPSHSEADIQ